MGLDKIALDRYLTTPPETNDWYYERVYDFIPETVLSQGDFDKYENILDQIIDVCVYAYNPEITPEQCGNFLWIMLKLNLIKGIDIPTAIERIRDNVEIKV